MIRLSEVIRIWRRGTGQSLKEASKEIGISVSTLDRLELGKQQVGGGRDGQRHGGQKPVQSGNGLDGHTLAKILRWLLAEDEPTVTTAHDRQDRQDKQRREK